MSQNSLATTTDDDVAAYYDEEEASTTQISTSYNNNNNGDEERAPPRDDKSSRMRRTKQSTKTSPSLRVVLLHSFQKHISGCCSCFRSSSNAAADEDDKNNLQSLARLLTLLRQYYATFGMPQGGSPPSHQQWVLEKLCSRLYAAGTPIWVLQPAMVKAAQGLMGCSGGSVRFLLLPRQALIFVEPSSSATMIDMERGFQMYMVTLMERVLVRLASFAATDTSNSSRPMTRRRTGGVLNSTNNSVQASQSFSELLEGLQNEPPLNPDDDFIEEIQGEHDRDRLAKEILNLASSGPGLFYLTQLEESGYEKRNDDQQVNSFWKVEPSIRELFTRLATIEAETSINAVDDSPSANAAYYPRWMIIMLRILSSAGAAGLWFSGSWQDMIVAGFLAIIVALFQGSSLWKHERMIFEVCVSFVVGLAAGLISLEWPEPTCFGAIAAGAVIDILQGFRIVYSIVELMSKHTLAGTSDLVEAFLFTGLIAVFLQCGQLLAGSIVSKQDSLYEERTGCQNPIDEMWYILILPVTSLAWAGLFLPSYRDLPVMALHGVLGFSVYFWVGRLTGKEQLSTLLGAFSVTFSAGIVSHLSGRQALGDTVTGLYVLVPGAYLAKELFAVVGTESIDLGMMYTLIINSVLIGLGAWTGTILCSPTILGTSKHRVPQLTSAASIRIRRSMVRDDEESSTPEQGEAMLFF